METQELLKTHVKSIMTSPVRSVTELESAGVVSNLFKELNIHHVPVVSDTGVLIGVISMTDIELLKHWATKYELPSSERQNKQLFKSMLAKDIMTRDVESVSPQNTLEYCAGVFKKNKIHSLPVVENGILIGIVTTHDMINVAYGISNKVL